MQENKKKPGKKNGENHKHHKKVLTEDQRSSLKRTLKSVGALLKEREELKSLSAAFDAKYVSVDTKGSTNNPYADKIKLNQVNLQNMKDVVREGFKGMNIDITLTNVYGVVNTGAAINQFVIGIDPAYSAEFASCAALFEEVRTKRVRFHYTSTSSNQMALGGVATAIPLGVGVFSIDVSNNAVHTSISDGIDNSNHAVYDTAITSAAAIEQRASTVGRRTKLTYHPPTIFYNGNAGGVVGSNWTDTQGAAGSVDVSGYAKFYEINNQINAAAVGVLLVYYDVEFRMRD